MSNRTKEWVCLISVFQWAYQYQWRALVNSLSSAHYLKATPMYIRCLFLTVSLSSFIFVLTVSWQLCAFSNIRPGLVGAYKWQCHYDPVTSIRKLLNRKKINGRLLELIANHMLKFSLRLPFLKNKVNIENLLKKTFGEKTWMKWEKPSSYLSLIITN